MAEWLARDPISVHRIVFREELRELHDYVQSAEQFLEKRAGHLEKRFEKLASEHDDPDTADMAAEPLRDEYWRVKDVFTQINRKALTVSVLGLLEHKLNELCNKLARRVGATQKVTDLPGKGFKRARKYLEKVIGLDLAGASTSWEELGKIQLVRNTIVHRNGLMREDDEKLRSYINDKTPHLNLNELNEIEILPTFLPHVVNVCEEFITVVFEQALAAKSPGTKD